MSEILTGYGEIAMLWFDGCGSENHAYDWPRIMAEIRRMQPGILIFNMGDPDYRWVGNEAGIAPQPCWNTVDAVPVSVRTDARDTVPHPTWLPAECDCMLRATNWFYSDADTHTVKSVAQLLGMYYYSVGRGCNLLLNLGPDRRGLLPDPDAARIRAFGAELRRRFSAPFATLTDCQTLDAGWAYTPPAPTLLDTVVLQEELTAGEHIRRFAIAVQPFPYGDPVIVYTGQNIGHKAICAFPPIEATSVRIELLEADGPVTLRGVEMYYVAGRE